MNKFGLFFDDVNDSMIFSLCSKNLMQKNSEKIANMGSIKKLILGMEQKIEESWKNEEIVGLKWTEHQQVKKLDAHVKRYSLNPVNQWEI